MSLTPCWTCDECGYTITTPEPFGPCCPGVGIFGGSCPGTLRKAELPSRWTRTPAGRLISLPESPQDPA